MALQLPNPDDVSLPDVATPGISYSATRRVTDSAGANLGRIEDRVRTALANALKFASDSLVSLTTKVATPITGQLNAADSKMTDLATLAKNSAQGQMQAAKGGATKLSRLTSPSKPFSLSGPKQGTPPATGGPPAAGGSGAGDAGCCDINTLTPTQYFNCLDQGGNPCAGPYPCDDPQTMAAAVQRANGVLFALFSVPLTCPPGDNYCDYGWWISSDCNLNAQPLNRFGTDPKPAGYIADFNAATSVAQQLGQQAANQLGINLDFVPADPATDSCIPCGGSQLCPDGSPPPCAIIINRCPDGTPMPPSGICPPPPPPPPPPGCCPPPVIPPCPPIPDCVGIKFCDLDELCKALKDCLTASKEDCALDNDTAYVFKDCQGDYGDAQTGWLGSGGDYLASINSVDDVVSTVMGILS